MDVLWPAGGNGALTLQFWSGELRLASTLESLFLAARSRGRLWQKSPKTHFANSERIQTRTGKSPGIAIRRARSRHVERLPRCMPSLPRERAQRTTARKEPRTRWITSGYRFSRLSLLFSRRAARVRDHTKRSPVRRFRLDRLTRRTRVERERM